MQNPPPPPALNPGIPISVDYLKRVIKRRWELFFVFFVPVVILAIVYLARAPRIYESTAVVQIEEREQRAFKPTDDQAQPDDLRGDDIIKTIEQNLQNYSLFVNVVSDPKIANDPSFLVGYKGKDLPPSIPDLAEWVHSNTKVALRHGTRLIDVTVEHQVPAMAQKLARAVVDSFVAINSQAQTSSQQDALKLLVSDSALAKRNLQKSEDSLQIYKESLLLKDQIDDQQRVIDALKQRYRDKHPQLIQARMLLAELIQNFDLEFKKVIATSSTESAYWASNSNALSSANPQDRVSTELRLVEARSEVLQKEVDTESALFDSVLKQMSETDVNQDAAATDITLVQPPPLPVRASRPNKTLTLLLSLVAGTVLGLAALLVADAIDSSIKTSVEAELLLGLPVLGIIPQLGGKKPIFSPTLFSSEAARAGTAPVTKNDLVVQTDPGGPAAEGFRSLRATVGLLGTASEHRTILFTSAIPAEGKTFVSCNYALALAQRGLKTLLVDTDLRRPAVHERMRLLNESGFVEVITGNLDLDQAVHANVFKCLDVLTAGARCPNPAELLAGSGFSRFLAQALKTYDRVVLDSSPVVVVSDSLLIVNQIDSVCMVVRASSTSRQISLNAVNLLRRARKEPSGIVLNGTSENGPVYPGYQGGYSGAGYR